MKQITKLWPLLCLALLLGQGCKKKEDPKPEPAAPSIAITGTNMGSFSMGEVAQGSTGSAARVDLNYRATAAAGIREIVLDAVTNNVTTRQTTLNSNFASSTAHEGSFNYVVPATQPAGQTQLNLTVTDVQGRSATTTFTVQIKPLLLVRFTGIASSVGSVTGKTVNLPASAGQAFINLNYVVSSGYNLTEIKRLRLDSGAETVVGTQATGFDQPGQHSSTWDYVVSPTEPVGSFQLVLQASDAQNRIARDTVTVVKGAISTSAQLFAVGAGTAAGDTGMPADVSAAVAGNTTGPFYNGLTQVVNNLNNAVSNVAQIDFVFDFSTGVARLNSPDVVPITTTAWVNATGKVNTVFDYTPWNFETVTARNIAFSPTPSPANRKEQVYANSTYLYVASNGRRGLIRVTELKVLDAAQNKGYVRFQVKSI